MNWKASMCLVALVSLMVMVVAGCTESGKQTTRPKGWTEETHSTNVDPNYEVVPPQDRVNQIKITISPGDWNAMQANIAELLGPRGTGQRGGQPGAPGAPRDRGGMIPGNVPPDGGIAPRAPGIPGWIGLPPIVVPLIK